MDVKMYKKDMLALLEKLVNVDSGSNYKEGVDKVGNLLAEKFNELGFSVERIKQETFGDHLRIRCGQGTKSTILIVAHMDTVFKEGTAKKRPFSIVGERAYGPGVIDMKASLVSVLYAFTALKKAGSEQYRNVEILITSDEEIGSPTSKALIEQAAKGKRYALVMEPARKDGSLVTERRGNGRFTLVVKGQAAHSGIEPEKGRSAIEELAYKIVKLHRLNDLDQGISINVGKIEGGDAVNTISPRAVGYIDVRVSTSEQAVAVEQKIEEVCATSDVKGTKIELHGHMKRPPMKKDQQIEELLQIVQEVGREMGLDLKDTATGGGSDASFTAAMGVATIDGLGPIGGNAHSEKEYLEIPSLTERTLLLAKIIERLGDEK
nr:M20 family metallopeptidase [Halalkalibacterium ligniniphilum]